MKGPKSSPRLSRIARYPQPKEVGGRLIRAVIAELRRAGFELPINSHILIAVSGGSDSLALAHLILKYGRRVAAPSKISLLHINHGWRGRVSDADARFVKRFGERWGVKTLLHTLEPDAQLAGASCEEQAREARKAIFQKEARKRRALILTAHQADDLAETLLWRLFTGTALTHGGGIAHRHGVEVRPLLQVRKSLLKAYLKEEKQRWREDSTNHSGRFLRSKMRQGLMPEIERLFPRAIERLVEQGMRAQQIKNPAAKDDLDMLQALFGASGLRTRKSHWDAIRESIERGGKATAIDLPQGWRLSRQSDEHGHAKRWVLETDDSVSSH